MRDGVMTSENRGCFLAHPVCILLLFTAYHYDDVERDGKRPYEFFGDGALKLYNLYKVPKLTPQANQSEIEQYHQVYIP